MKLKIKNKKCIEDGLPKILLPSKNIKTSTVNLLQNIRISNIYYFLEAITTWVDFPYWRCRC